MDLEDDVASVDGVDEAEASRSQAREERRTPHVDKPRDLKGDLRAAVAQHKEPSPGRQAAAQQRAREETGKFASTSSKENNKQIDDRGDDASRVPANNVSGDGKKVEGSPAATTPQASSVAAPAALSKDVRAIWDTLPAQVQSEFVRRENDTAEGVKKLQERYRPIEDVLAPVRPLLQQRGLTEGQAVKQLFDWHHALAGPNKVQAAHALLRSHGIDPSTLAGQQSGASQNQDPNNQPLHPILQQTVERQQNLESHFQRQQQERINNDLAAFSKDKPHFEKVRVAMAQMMGGGFATSLEDAYNKAVWADPETRAAIQQEEQDKRAADAAAALEADRVKASAAEEERKRKAAEDLAKARKAGVSPRSGAPNGAMPIAKGQQGKSVGSTIRDAIKLKSGTI